MTQPRDIDRLLDEWFADGSSVAPDRIVDIVADRIERQPQRPAWRLDWRHLPMTTTFKFASAIAAFAIIGLIGYNLLPRNNSTGVGGSAPSASPTVSPTASPTVIPSATPAASPAGVRPLPDGKLTAGTYSKTGIGDVADLTATFTVPDGWVGHPEFGVTGPSDTDAPLGAGIVLMQANGAFDDPCHWDTAGTGSTNQSVGKVVGPTVDDLVAAIRANTSYTSTTPIDVTIDGHPGKRLDLQLPSDLSFASCDKERGDTTGNYFPFTYPAPLYAQGPGNRWHLSIIDVNGSRLIVVSFDYERTPADVQADGQTIVDSIKFSK